MKNIILTITLLYISIACAQERIIDGDNRPKDYFPQKGDYIVYDSLNDFEGTFVYENNSGERVEIYLEKKKFCFDDVIGYCAQILIGTYEYKNNNDLLVSKREVRYSNDKITSTEYKSSPLPQITSIGNEKNKITLSIHDTKKDKQIVGIFTKLESGKY